jgi:hypothetical protein
MKNAFGQFDEEAYQAFLDSATEKYDFGTCQRPDGSKYGSPGRCIKGSETSPASKDDKKSSSKAASGGGGGGSSSGPVGKAETKFNKATERSQKSSKASGEAQTKLSTIKKTKGEKSSQYQKAYIKSSQLSRKAAEDRMKAVKAGKDLEVAQKKESEKKK